MLKRNKSILSPNEFQLSYESVLLLQWKKSSNKLPPFFLNAKIVNHY